MFDNVAQHVAARPAVAVIFAVSFFVLVFAVPYFMKQNKLYGSMFTFASKGRKVSAALAGFAVVFIGLFFVTPYTPPPSDEIAIVIGNTQNTPMPVLDGEVASSVVDTMLAHKGDEVDTVSDSIKFISAVKQPSLVNLEKLGVQLRKIGSNSANAERDARMNIDEITQKINAVQPSDNGANYLEAIIKARDNVKPGSRIIVIGSGLSDSGDLNFSKDSLLTNEDKRSAAIQALQEKYGSDQLQEYSVEFYGLGDTVKPQEALSSLQKGIVRDIYKDAIKALGGTVTTSTRTLAGNAIETQYVVGTTDTGCGDINLIFDDNDLKFVGDKAIFIDKAAAGNALLSVKSIWDKQQDTIVSIQVDGYTAHYPGAGELSQDRANTVKDALVGFGIPVNKVTATGKGYGPYDTDAKNRAVKVNISRDTDQCIN